MTTWADIINLALKDSGVLGVGQAAQPQDISDAFTRMKMMLAQWQRKRFLVYHLTDNFITTTGALSYSVGPGGDFNISRPDVIEAAFFRQLITSPPSQIDYVFRLIYAREDYNRIQLKSLGTWPEYLFYDSAYPLGFIYPWPVPMAGQFEIHLSLKEQLKLSDTATVDDTVNLPPEYEAAVLYNLAARLRPAYQLPPDPQVSTLAQESLTVLRDANAQIPTLLMPNSVLPQRTAYNVYSDSP